MYRPQADSVSRWWLNHDQSCSTRTECRLTIRGTTSEVASYEFTTLTTVPGTLEHNGARLQILDLPGIIEGAKDGKGRGRQVIAVARTCNLIFIVLDVLKPLNDLAILTNELEGFGIRLNKQPPKITVKRRETGGVSVPFRSLLTLGFIEAYVCDDWGSGCVIMNLPFPSLSPCNEPSRAGFIPRSTTLTPDCHRQHCPSYQTRPRDDQSGFIRIPNEQLCSLYSPGRRNSRGSH